MRATVVLLAVLLAATSAEAQLPHPDHIVVVIMENKAFGDVIDPPGTPLKQSHAAYINGTLVAQGALLKASFGLHHPSQPNYLELYAGSNLGVCTDDCFTAVNADNLAARLKASKDPKHNTLVGFAENFAAICKVAPTDEQYVQRHCPWRLVTPLGVTKDFPLDFPKDFTQLPAVAFVIPNLFDDMHSVDPGPADAAAAIAKTPKHRLTPKQEIPFEVHQGDTWLKDNVDAYVQWAMTHNSILILTWDEDSADHPHVKSCADALPTKPPDNRIPTIIIGANIKHTQSNQQITHHDVLRTILDLEGLPAVGASKDAAPITGIWQ